jgi:hypothetical protein
LALSILPEIRNSLLATSGETASAACLKVRLNGTASSLDPNASLCATEAAASDGLALSPFFLNAFSLYYIKYL